MRERERWEELNYKIKQKTIKTKLSVCVLMVREIGIMGGSLKSTSIVE